MFLGTWVSSELQLTNIPNASQNPATLKFAGSEWTLTVPGLNAEKGTYSFYPNIDYAAFLYQNGSNVGNAKIIDDIMTVTLTIPGPLYASVGQFTKQ